MNVEERLEMLDKAADILLVADNLVIMRTTEGGEKTSEACMLDLPYVAGLYFGTVGACKLLRGDVAVAPELNYINVLAANYALFLESIGAAEFKPTTEGVEPGTVVVADAI